MLGRPTARRAACVTEEVIAAWRREAPAWFAGSAPLLEAAPDSAHLRRIETPLGPIVAKRTRARARAWRAFERAEALRAAGLETPEPLAAWPDEAGNAGVLVTRFAPEPGLLALARECGEAGEVTLESLCSCLGRAVARLHTAHFRHRDLKAANLLVRPLPPEGYTLLFLDLDGLAARTVLPRRTRLRDLARLRVSFESRAAHGAGLRAHHFETVLRGYLEGTDEDGARWRSRTASWARRHSEHMLASGRALE